MPPSHTGLSEESRQKAIEWVKAKWKNGRCPHCLDLNWTIGSHMVSLLASVGETTEINMGDMVVFPNVVVICKNCGHTVLVNAYYAGVLQDQSSEEKEAVDANK